MKIRAYLLLMAVAIAIPIIIFSTVALNMLLESERRAALRSLDEVARATALLVDRELSSAEAALRVLAQSPHLAYGDMRSFYYHAKAADRGDSARTILFAQDGQQLINTVVPFNSSLPPPPAYVVERTRQVIRSQKTVVSDLITGAVQRRPVTTINIPVPLFHGERYVLGSVFATDYFQKLLAERPLPQTWKIALLDSEGRFIARSGNPDDIGRKANALLVARAALQVAGQLQYAEHDGSQVYEAFTSSAMAGWTVAVSAPMHQIEASAQKAVITSSLGLLVALIVAFVAATVFGRRLVASVTHATGAAEALGHGKVPEPERIGVEELDKLHAALKSAGMVLSASEAERAALLKSEQEARTLAEQQNQSKDEFLAMLGHELRNPLGGISGAVELMEMEGAGEERKARAREILRRQTGHLERIVDDLLDLARISRGKITLDMQPVQLGTVVQATVDALRASGRNKHKLTLDIAPVWVMGDRTRLDQIVNNLLTNALKYTPEGGSIDVRLHAGAHAAVLTVRDNGIGISRELLPRLFDIFIQGKVALDRSEGGLGIGLSLVRRLVQLHKGTITAESEGQGRGSVFTVRLPMTAAPVVVEPAAAPDIEAGACSVLLVEDNDDARRVMAEKLIALGMRVLESVDGKSGLQMALAEMPDVAIVDIGLPGMNGYEVARHLRADKTAAGMGLIALTGYGQEADRRNALEAGFDVHFVKPVRFDLLADAVHRLNARKRRRVTE